MRNNRPLSVQDCQQQQPAHQRQQAGSYCSGCPVPTGVLNISAVLAYQR